MLRFYSFIIGLCLLLSCSPNPKPSEGLSNLSITEKVNPFIGTGGHGHTFPGATVPFGMLQLSPDTRLEGWDGCSGYHYTDKFIYGFSHTHLSGTGVSDYGDILLMPSIQDENVFNNGADGEAGYRLAFSHENESASAGYYQVKMDNDIQVDLSASKRVGFHRYHFPKGQKRSVYLDLAHRDKLHDAEIQQIDAQTIVGYRHSDAWAKNQQLFFAMQFSEPILEMISSPIDPAQTVKKSLKARFLFGESQEKPILIKVGISAVSIAGAQRNLEAEIPHWNFDQVQQEAKDTWTKALSKIEIEGGSMDQQKTFYSALYHTMIAPNLYQDVDGQYRDMDGKVHQSKEHEHYTVFSLWDTYRAAHPLFTIIEQDRTNDFIKTFIKKYESGGILPIWDLSANYTGCMIGYHAIPVIADAYLKGIRDYDADKAYEAMKHSAEQNHLGLAAYKKQGFIPVEEESESVSKTLEYAYDDWCIAQMAKAMGKTEDYKTYLRRAQNYKNIFDPKSKFFRGRLYNTLFEPFNPYEVNFNYTEANAWQYGFYVPQDINTFVKMMGGEAAFETQLDALFTAEQETSGRHQVDITGLIGQYAHGNEPSHHIAYLYNHIGKAYKGQKLIRQILDDLYSNTPEGLSGNEDCGQMSAWYIMSSLGFYPVTPGANYYELGAPLFPKASINLENGKQFSIIAKNNSDKNIYVQSVSLNGAPYPFSYIKHADIMKGGQLTFTMSEQPNKDWGKEPIHQALSLIDTHLIAPTPFIKKGKFAFKDSTIVELSSSDPAAEIFYAIGNKSFEKYAAPILVNRDLRLTFFSDLSGQPSPAVNTLFRKVDKDIKVEVKHLYAPQYAASGDLAIVDGIRGTKDFRTGTWQGYQSKNFEATIDLGKERTFKSISTTFLQDQNSWIFMPTKVEYEISNDGTNYRVYDSAKNTLADQTQVSHIRSFKGTGTAKAKYIKVKAINRGTVPDWHIGAGGGAWIFVDEMLID